MSHVTTFVALLARILFVFVAHLSGHSYGNGAAQPRTLIYPPTSPTRIQFIGGIGIPVENLNYESITSGYVLKAEYFLPTEAYEWQKTYLHPQTIHRRSLNVSQRQQFVDQWQRNESIATHSVNQQYQQIRTTPTSTTPLSSSSSSSSSLTSSSPSSLYRWIIYQAIEQLLERANQPGRPCMLRSICEHAAMPMHFGSGILAEILHIILSPSRSSEPLTRADYAAYYEAERTGHMGRIADSDLCTSVYHQCSQSPLDHISAIFDIDRFD